MCLTGKQPTCHVPLPPLYASCPLSHCPPLLNCRAVSPQRGVPQARCSKHKCLETRVSYIISLTGRPEPARHDPLLVSLRHRMRPATTPIVVNPTDCAPGSHSGRCRLSSTFCHLKRYCNGSCHAITNTNNSTSCQFARFACPLLEAEQVNVVLLLRPANSITMPAGLPASLLLHRPIPNMWIPRQPIPTGPRVPR